MFEILGNLTYRRLFLAQIVALLGTGLATVALGLLAFDLAGPRAGTVLGTAYAIKMVAYVAVAPIAAAFAEHLPRRTMLVSLDLVRALIALLLPFVTEVWQVYLLIFLLQSASAGFTPTFQATIPDILPKEKDYTIALSLSRLAYDLENLISPMLAALLLVIVNFQTLFSGTVLGFLGSSLLVLSVVLPSPQPKEQHPIYERTKKGTRIYLATPRLRGLLAVSLAVASAGAMVIVNTVVVVQGEFGLTERFTALALAAFGGGSMVAALGLPHLLSHISDRTAMLTGVAVLIVGLLAGGFVTRFEILVVLWFLLGMGYSSAQTPSGRLLKRSSHAPDRPALFAAQFALSHACWLLAYPLAGWLGGSAGLPAAFLTLGGLATLGLLAALMLWPASDREVLVHRHPGLAASHPHFREAAATSGSQHAHTFVIDDLHPRWPEEP